MKHIALFNGIGGFQLAAQWMGWENVASVEIADFPSEVTKFWFPNCKQFKDIFDFNGKAYKGKIDIITGGFPCQPFSHAGKREGTDDNRHLWPQMLRIIREVQPSYVVAENVPGLLTIEGGIPFEQVHLDLENEGYEVQAVIVPACGVDAPHRRDRVWIVANRNGNGFKWRDSFHEVNAGERGVYAFSDFESSFNDGTTPHPNNNGLHDPKDRQGMGAGNDRNEAGTNQAGELAGRAGADAGVAPISTNAGPESVRHGRENAVHGLEVIAHTESNGDRGGLRGMAGTNVGFRKPEEHRQGYSESRHIGEVATIADTENQNGTLPARDEPQHAESGNDGSNGIIADTCRSGCQELNTTAIATGQRQRTGLGAAELPNWDNFPSQPSIRGRDDGVSARLVYASIFAGITHPKKPITYHKWRNEAIKGFGNAIVPQVAFEIFKALESSL